MVRALKSMQDEIGLAVGGDVLPTATSHLAVPFWRDAIAGGVAATCYGVFYAMPARMLIWPAAAGILAHATRWLAHDEARLGTVPAIVLACLVAGTVVLPGARRFHLPFAGVGFASVVSMLPGIFLFPMSSALVLIAQNESSATSKLVGAAVGDGTTAILVVFGMTLGLLFPKSLLDAFGRWRMAAKTSSNVCEVQTRV